MSNHRNHYTIWCKTQTSDDSATDSKVTIRLWGVKGRSQFIRIERSDIDDFDGGDNNIYNIKGFGNLGEIFRIDITVGSDGWRPESITIRYNENGHITRFTNYSDKLIDSETFTMYADNLVKSEIQNNLFPHKEEIWYGYDYRESSSSQSISQSESMRMLSKITHDTEHNLSVETGFTLTNESTMESGNGIGPAVKSSIKSEFYSKMSSEIKKAVHTENTSEFIKSYSLTFTVPAATLLLIKYEVNTLNRLGELTFFDGSKQKIIVPVYEKWSLSEIPIDRIEIRSDSQMSQEYRDLYKQVFGKDWRAKPYAKVAA